MELLRGLSTFRGVRNTLVSAAIHARGRALRAWAAPRARGRPGGQRSGRSRERGGTSMSAAGPPQGVNYSPSGGSAAAAAASVGAHQ
jgi:hypothetical protein